MNKPINIKSIDKIKNELSKIEDESKRNRILRFIGSALSSIPWVGGFFGASADLHGEIEQGKINELQKLWLEEHQKKMEELAHTIFQIIEKIESSKIDYKKRLVSEEYLSLVRKGFKEWDNSETTEKKEYIRKLLTNACATTVINDALIRLFIDWVKTYHETHFLVVKEIYKNKGITRAQIWNNLNLDFPKEDSVEADLYKLLIRDLSTGGIIRQYRATDYNGNFIKKKAKKTSSRTLKSAFDNQEQYVLTELGKSFVHFTMEDVVTRIEKE